MHDKLTWFNPNIEFMFHANIVEYDMNAMSVSISEKYELLDKDTIELLKLLPKEQRTRKVGLIQRDNKEYSERLISCELETRRKFIETNKLSEDNVISLHSDACIFNSRKEIINDIEGIKFKHASTWVGYMRFNGVEIFYTEDGALEFKGVPKDMINAHTLGLNLYLANIFKKIEDYDDGIIEYMSTFEDKYMRDKLPYNYYTPFGRRGEYKMSNMKLFGFLANVVLNEMKGW